MYRPIRKILFDGNLVQISYFDFMNRTFLSPHIETDMKYIVHGSNINQNE